MVSGELSTSLIVSSGTVASRSCPNSVAEFVGPDQNLLGGREAVLQTSVHTGIHGVLMGGDPIDFLVSSWVSNCKAMALGSGLQRTPNHKSVVNPPAILHQRRHHARIHLEWQMLPVLDWMCLRPLALEKAKRSPARSRGLCSCNLCRPCSIRGSSR